MRRALVPLLAAWAALSLLAAPAEAFTDEVIMIPLETAATGPVMVPVWVVYPDDYDPAKPVTTLLAFPPGDQTLEMVDVNFNWFVPQALDRGWLTIGPAAPTGFGFARQGRPLLGPLIDELLKRFPVADGKFHLAGQSNGGNTAFAAALDFPDGFRSITVIPGSPPDAAENANVDRLKGIGVHMFVGEQDLPYLERMNVTREALRAAGIPSDLTIIPGSGHVINFLRGANARMMFDAM